MLCPDRIISGQGILIAVNQARSSDGNSAGYALGVPYAISGLPQKSSVILCYLSNSGLKA